MHEKLRCMLIFGTRPEVIKLAPVALAMRQDPSNFECILVSTGQHRELSAQALAMFGLKPDIDLDLMVGDQTVSEFFGRAISGLDQVIFAKKPHWVFVQGDTGTVLAGAIAAYYRRIPVAHIEAGMRSHDLMSPHPEEGNRQMVSRVTSLHFPPTEGARKALLDEGISDKKILVTGNTVVDAVKLIYGEINSFTSPDIVAKGAMRMVLTTIHRRESFGAPLLGVLEAIKELASNARLELNFLIPVHPNPAVNSTIHKILGKEKNVQLVNPIGYKDMLAAMAKSWIILTDSSGLQEEAPYFKVPVLVLRNVTERPEGIANGVARLVGTDKNNIIEAITGLVDSQDEYDKMREGQNPYGDGFAARRIVDRIQKEAEYLHA